MDTTIFDDTARVDDPHTPMIEKSVIWQNSIESSYNGYITFNLSQISGAGRYVDWKNGYLQIPYLVSLKSAQNITAAGAVNKFSAILKNGSHQLINSISVSYNTVKIVEQTDHINQFVSYKLMTGLNNDDVDKLCGTINFCPDDGEDFIYQDDTVNLGNNSNGTGLLNTRVRHNDAGTTNYDNNVVTYNRGGYRRAKEAVVDLVQATAALNSGALAVGVTEARLVETATPYFTNDGGTDEKRIYTWVYMATIRLRDLSDFFEQCPLISGALLNITLNYNSCNFTIGKGAAANTGFSVTSYTQTSGNCNPILYPSAEANFPNSVLGVAGNAVSLVFSTGINKTLHTTGHPIQDVARIYLPIYKFSSEAETALIQSVPERPITFQDVRMFSFVSNANNNFSQLISGGVSNVQKLVIIPQYNIPTNARPAGVLANSFLQDSWVSPFSTAPGTTANYAQITNFQVLLGGKAVLTESLYYGYQQFLDELYSDNSPSGNQDKGMEVGLIDKAQWQSGYRYLVVDLARRAKSQDSASLSIQVNGRNATSQNITFFCFIVFKRSFTVQLVNGQIVKPPMA